MNARHSHCTSKIAAMSALLLAFCVQEIQAQTSYDKTMDCSFWNDGWNIAGSRTGSLFKDSYAEMSGGLYSGDFKSPYESASAWDAGVIARTRTDLEKFSMTGSFSFRQKQGDNMCGSMFINPGYYPVDVLEFTPGTKTLQTYSFDGGIAIPLNRRWSIGGMINYESDNYAKRKDIRHTNYHLGMDVAPSVLLTLENSWKMGLSGIFSKTSESIQAEQIGTATASSYYAFLDKGMMYGTRQVWNGSGIHLNESGIDRFAVKEYSEGAAFQVQRLLNGKSLYADIEYDFTHGEVGEKSYTFFKFPGSAFSARAGLKLDRPGGTDLFRVNYQWKKQDNNEYVIEKISSGGVTTPVTYGSNKIYERRNFSIVPEYTFYGQGQMSWLYKAHAEAGLIRSKEQSALVFPYSFTRSSTILSAEGSIILQYGRFRIGAEAFWSKGVDVSEKAVENGSGNVSATSTAFREGSWNNLEQEWKNAARIGSGLSLRCGFSLMKVQNLYAEISGSLLHGFSISYAEGSDRFTGIFKFGYEF